MEHFDGARLSPNSARNAVWHALNEPVCQYLRTRNPRCSTVYIDNSLGPLARDSPWKNVVKLLKTIQTYRSCSNMFRFTQEPSSESYNQSLAKITSLVQKCVPVQTLLVLWRLILTCYACLWFTVRRGTSLLSEQYKVCADTYCWTRLVILANFWL